MLLMAAGGLLVVLVCVDMGIKQYIEENFEEEEERETILDKVVLRKVYNKGFCFNTLDKKPELVRKTSGILCAGLAIYDAWLFLKKGKWLRKFGMVFLTAGAISNTYDRLFVEKSLIISESSGKTADFEDSPRTWRCVCSNWGSSDRRSEDISKIEKAFLNKK